ncbi:hypothetical protein ACJ72_05475 [Emergomyces africanus]|uniref:DUF7703 domain-containing protein n=1 Tax=Emergomyces africanus TaxID=1955775 RepID=A0A1B7NTT0_9EURO|nr:hypothetical protein ACJ72_05475 [Emergomyces africanus]
MANETDNDDSDICWLPTGPSMAITCLLAVGLYNAVELFVLIFVVFSSFKGLYFWSLLLTTSLGIVPYAIGSLIYWVKPSISSEMLPLAAISVGWWVMTSGHSLILYSRLHLVLRNRKALCLVLFMIGANALILHLPSAIITFGFYTRVSLYEAYFTLEKVQITVLFAQELILSALYIFETIKMLRLAPDKGNKRILSQLISINVIIILMDIGLLTAIYANLYLYEPMARVAIYSVKFKLEFAILGQLVKVSNSHSNTLDFTIGSNGFPDFVDPNRITTDITRPRRLTSTTSKPLESELDDTTDTAAFSLDFRNGHPNSHHEACGCRCRSAPGTSSNYPNTPNGSSQSVSREGKVESGDPESACPG